MTTLQTNQEAVFNVGAVDDTDNPKPAGFSAQVGGYPGAYVALVGSNQLHFVARAAGTYNVTINGHSADGTPLPALSLDFIVSEPPVPQATHLTATAPTVRGQDIITPADPSTDTVVGTV